MRPNVLMRTLAVRLAALCLAAYATTVGDK